MYVGLSVKRPLPVQILTKIGICPQSLAKISSTIFYANLTDDIHTVACGHSEWWTHRHDKASSRYSQLICKDTWNLLTQFLETVSSLFTFHGNLSTPQTVPFVVLRAGFLFVSCTWKPILSLSKLFLSLLPLTQYHPRCNFETPLVPPDICTSGHLYCSATFPLPSNPHTTYRQVSPFSPFLPSRFALHIKKFGIDSQGLVIELC